MSPSSKPVKSKAHSSPKSVIVFGLEDVLIPGKMCPELDMKSVHAFMNATQKWAKSKGARLLLISGFTEKACKQKMREFDLEKYFATENVYAVNPSYLDKMEPLDRQLYEKRCENDPFCKDEYYRQVEMQALMKREAIDPSHVVLVGHDYWFDGFYTRRFSMVDVAFIETALSSRGKPITEKVEGVWYVQRDFKSLKKILEGKITPPNYAPLDAWVSVSLTEELLGGKGFNMIKRTIIDRKKLKSNDDFQKIA